MEMRNWDRDEQLRSRCTTEMHQDGDVHLRSSIHWDEEAQLRFRWSYATEIQMHHNGDAQLRFRWRCATEIEMHQDGVTQMRSRCIEMEMHKLRSRCIKIKMRNWDQDGNVQLRDSDAAPMVAVATNCNCSPTRKVIALVNSLKCHS